MKHKGFTSPSGLALIFILTCLFVWRLTHIVPNEMSWDVLGYYMHLPATFIHNDPLLTNVDWLKKEVETRQLSGTLYMVSSTPDGKPMYFFLMGMALLYLPFFLFAHFIAAPLLGFPCDGFSLPYIYAMVCGALVYTTAALVLLRKVLRHFFADNTVAILLILLAFASNAIHHLSLKNLETVNYLFFFVTLMIFLSIRWHQSYKPIYMHLVFVAGAITTLIKPSEIFIFLIPLLWQVYDKESVRKKWNLLFVQHRKTLLLGIAIALIIVLPQMLYFYQKTGSLIYDSYKNPGVGIDWWSPHIFEILFSFRKGWIVYTPLALFFIAGIWYLWKFNKGIALAISVYAGISFYIMASWTEWWYGAAYSCRPVITLYPALLIGMGYLLENLPKSKWIKSALFLLFSLFIALNIFQYHQFLKWIIHPYRTTFAYYKEVFLKSHIPPNAENLLLIDRSFGEDLRLPPDFPDAYVNKSLLTLSEPLSVKASEEYVLDNSLVFSSITSADYLFLKCEMKWENLSDSNADYPLMVLCMDRSNGNYAAQYTPMKPDSNGWVSTLYLTPELRSKKDRVKLFVWNKYNQDFIIQEVKWTAFYKEK